MAGSSFPISVLSDTRLRVDGIVEPVADAPVASATRIFPGTRSLFRIVRLDLLPEDLPVMWVDYDGDGAKGLLEPTRRGRERAMKTPSVSLPILPDVVVDSKLLLICFSRFRVCFLRLSFFFSRLFMFSCVSLVEFPCFSYLSNIGLCYVDRCVSM